MRGTRMRRGVVILAACVAALMLPGGAAAAAPKLSINDATVTEPGAGATTTASFEVKLSKKASEKVKVNFATAPGSAGQSDFVAASGKVKIKPGKRSAELPITINGDAADEPNETFTVELSKPKHAKVRDDSGIGTIVDDDAPGGGGDDGGGGGADGGGGGGGPSGAADTDGDGVADASDNCPAAPNAGQADGDGDGAGDVCDVCPADANTTTCSGPNPDDTDADGVPNAQDNCPAVANSGQQDGDADGRGDVCDPCPNAANPGSLACPATIYQVKEGLVPNGSEVRISNAMVTAVAPGGGAVWVGVQPGDPVYNGPEFSGMEVDVSQISHPALAVGDRIDFQGSVADPLVARLEIVVQSQGGTPTAAVTTPGAFPAAFDDVLAEVGNVNLDSGGGTDQWSVSQGGDGVGVQAGLIANLPNYANGTDFTAIRGIAGTGGADPVLKPRSTADIVPAAPAVDSITVSLSCFDAGQSNIPVATVRLTSPAAGDTFVSVDSSDLGVATVTGGGTTVPSGSDSAPVFVSTLSAGTATLTATLGTSQTTDTLTVDNPCQPALTSRTVERRCFESGQSGVLLATIGLDAPAPAGGTTINLSSSDTGVATVPASVTAAAGSDSVTVSGDAVTAGQTTLTATRGSDVLTARVVVGNPCPAPLVINEVDYDQINTDTAEFIEIYNPSGSPVSLANLAVALINGTGTNGVEYTPRFALSTAGASLAAGQYLVIANSSVAVPAGALKIDSGAASNLIQNGSPDGVALIDTSTLTVIDALSYEGSITAATITGFPGPVSLVEGTATVAADTGNGSLTRSPNGQDTDNAAADWSFATTVSPGAANP